MRTPIETVSEWFDCFARGDLAAARRLFAADGVFYVFASGKATEIRGYDQFLDWYGRRRESLGDSFEYRVDELLAGDRHAAALITLSRIAAGRRFEWRQVAVFEVQGGVITEARAYEEAERGGGS
jgi:ketosteroid isomerase-like protein